MSQPHGVLLVFFDDFDGRASNLRNVRELSTGGTALVPGIIPGLQVYTRSSSGEFTVSRTTYNGLFFVSSNVFPR